MKTEAMNKAFGYIDAMADKLGVASEHVYGVLVKQAYIDGVRDLILGFVLILVIYLLVRASKWLYEEDMGEGIFFTGTGILLAGIFSCICIYSGIGELINPEYYAIKEILDTIKGD